MVLPAGSTLPPVPYLVAVLAAGALLVALLRRRDLSLETSTVLAFAPWMVAGSAIYAAYEVGVVPAILRPLTSSPTVYLSTAILAGAAWLAIEALDAEEVWLAVLGALVALIPLWATTSDALAAGTFAPGWSLFAAGLSVALAAGLWWCFGRARPAVVERVGLAGWLAVFAHVLDGVSTTVGIDVLGFGEQTPLSALLLDVGAALPTAPYLGTGWVFFVVKAVLAIGLVWLIAPTVRDDPPVGNALLLLITAVGLGPATYNLVLFAVAGPAGF